MITSCQEANRVLSEFIKSGKKKQSFYCGKLKVELNRK